MSTSAAVFQIGSLGDSIVSVPTLLSIREFLPDCSEYFLVSRFDTKAKVLPVDIFKMAWEPARELNYTNPEQRLLTFFTLSSLLMKLRYYRPRYCVYLMPTDREPERVERDIKFFSAAGVKELLGFQVMTPSSSAPEHPVSVADTEAFRKFQRLWGSGAPAKFPQYSRVPTLAPGVPSAQRVNEWLLKKRLQPGKRLVALAPWSNLSSRDIPEQTIVEIIQRLSAAGDAEVVMVGGGKDFERAEKVLAQAASGINACGVFSVAESAALFQACALAICTESGPMHLAGAVGTPLLAAFSRTNKRLAQWLPSGHNLTVLYRDVPCAGCEAPVCPVSGHPCMRDITADQVVASALSILNGAPVEEGKLNGTKVFTW